MTTRWKVPRGKDLREAQRRVPSTPKVSSQAAPKVSRRGAPLGDALDDAVDGLPGDALPARRNEANGSLQGSALVSKALQDVREG